MSPTSSLGPFKTLTPYAAGYYTTPSKDSAGETFSNHKNKIGWANACQKVDELWEQLKNFNQHVQGGKKVSLCVLKGRGQLQEFVRSIDKMEIKFRVFFVLAPFLLLV